MENKLIKPVIPMSEEEHDKEVNEVWYNDNAFADSIKKNQVSNMDFKLNPQEKPQCEYCCDGNHRIPSKSLLREDLCVGETPIVDIDVYILKDELEMRVSNMDDDTVIHSTIKIKYCPNCGRELNGND